LNLGHGVLVGTLEESVAFFDAARSVHNTGDECGGQREEGSECKDATRALL
jgi:hypothetical protein